MPQSPEPQRLKLLHLEESELDHELACAHLRRGGHELRAMRVQDEASFRAALQRGGWDVVLSDFNLRGMDGLRALKIAHELAPEVPVLLVSGEIGEDMAVQAMRDGAADHLLKNNLARLVSAVGHAIEAGRDRAARRRADRELEASRQRMQELAQHLQTSVEMERAAIAREIHDDVGGALTAVKFDLAWIARHSGDDAVQQRVVSAVETLDHAIEASKRIMHNLRPAILEQGLVAAVQWMASRFEKRNGVVCQFRTSQESMQLPAGVPLVAYRFVQEALTNIAKHAHASRVLIDLSLTRGVLSVEVSDNGAGFSAADLDKARSFGIRGLRQRADTVGGWVDVISGTGGSTLMLSVPVGPRPLEDGGYFEDSDLAHDPSVWGKA